MILFSRIFFFALVVVIVFRPSALPFGERLAFAMRSLSAFDDKNLYDKRWTEQFILYVSFISKMNMYSKKLCFSFYLWAIAIYIEIIECMVGYRHWV